MPPSYPGPPQGGSGGGGGKVAALVAVLVLVLILGVGGVLWGTGVISFGGDTTSEASDDDGGDSDDDGGDDGDSEEDSNDGDSGDSGDSSETPQVDENANGQPGENEEPQQNPDQPDPNQPAPGQPEPTAPTPPAAPGGSASNTPEDAARQVIEALGQADCATLLQLGTARYMDGATTLEDCQQIFTPGGSSSAEVYSTVVQSNDGASAEVQMQVRMGDDTGPRPMLAYMVNEAGTWKLDGTKDT